MQEKVHRYNDASYCKTYGLPTLFYTPYLFHDTSTRGDVYPSSTSIVQVLFTQYSISTYPTSTRTVGQHYVLSTNICTVDITPQE